MNCEESPAFRTLCKVLVSGVDEGHFGKINFDGVDGVVLGVIRNQEAM